MHCTKWLTNDLFAKPCLGKEFQWRRFVILVVIVSHEDTRFSDKEEGKKDIRGNGFWTFFINTINTKAHKQKQTWKSNATIHSEKETFTNLYVLPHYSKTFRCDIVVRVRKMLITLYSKVPYFLTLSYYGFCVHLFVVFKTILWRVTNTVKFQLTTSV